MKKYLKYIIPSLITFIILGVIYYFNDLYPFGSKPLVQVDADYIYIPIMYKIWDILHYGSNIFYTDLGLGNSIYGSLIIQGSLFSPFNLILYLVSRDNLVNFMGTFIIIKLCLLSLTSYIYINHKYNTINYFYKLLFSILYTFNGFIIFNYFNHMWLDIIILFPILVIYLDKLLNNNNILGYIFILSLCLIISFYYSYFILIFILFYSFINIYLFDRKDNKEIVFKLGKGTLISILISSFSSLPLMYQILSSSRFNTSVSTELFSSLPMKSLIVLFNPLMITMYILLLTKYKTNKKKIYSYFFLLVLYLIPVIFDPINALIHGGTYWSFPYRYGFITSFVLMDGSLYYISNYVKDKDTNINLLGKIFYIIIIVLLIILMYLNLKNRSIIIDKGILLNIDKEIYLLLLYTGIIIVSYILSLFIKGKIYKYASLTIISIFSIFLFTSLTIYYNKGYFLTTNAKNLYDNIELPKDDGRYKVEYSVYTPYYGLMYNINTIDNWLHIIPSNVLEVHKKLGYYVTDTRDYSYGGTIFSDYLLNIKYLFSNEDKTNDNMYTLIDKYDNKYLYKYNYNLSYAIPFNNLNEITYDNRFNYQNNIYKNLFNKKKNIIEYQEYNDNNSDIIFKINKPGYLYLDTQYYDDISNIKINDNYIYDFDNYIKYLGYYNTDITINITTKKDKKIKYSIGFVSKEDIMNLSTNIKYDSHNYYINNTNNYKYLYIPINNIKGINIYNNKKRVDTYNYIDNYIYIKLNKGENNIKINYNQPLFNIGLILSIIGILLLIFNNKIKPNKILLNITYYLFIFITIFIFLYFYLFSLLKYML